MPTSAVLPKIASESTAVASRPPHWVCVITPSHPFVGLCGELTNGWVVTQTDEFLCHQCRELAPVHASSCPRCAEWVAIIL